MKRKIIVSFLILFLFFAAGAVLSTVSIRNTTAALERLIKLHQVEDLRQHLIMSIQTVQSDLYTVGTLLGHKVDAVTENVSNLEETAKGCLGCHHSPEITGRLEKVGEMIGDYQNSLSFYITASANKENIERMKLDAAAIGNELLTVTGTMSMEASKKLSDMTSEALARAGTVRKILLATMVLTFLFSVIIAVRLTRSVTQPVGILLNATRAIASGNLGYTVAYRDKTEFGELSTHFNEMSSALKDGYDKLAAEIAERKQTEAELVKSEAFLNTIFDSIHDPFCIFDRDFRVVRANDAYAAMKSKDIPALVGKTCYELFYHRDTVCRDCIVEKTFLSHDSCAKEKMVVSEGGLTTWYEVYTYPILDSEGKISHVIEYTRDITERKRTEEALRESEERYALAAQGANDGLWDWNLRDNRIYYSIRWKSMLGFGEREIGDDPEAWHSRIHPDDRDTVSSKISAHLRQENTHFEIEYRIMHRDGSYRWMLCRGLAVRDSKGKAYRVAGSQTDITARKLAEEQLLHDAFHDALTGLPNRALFRDRLQHAINSARRIRTYRYAVLFIDVDRFKVINDSLGHSVGDQLLVEMGRRLSKALRPGDTVARLGGDEFAILLESVKDLSDAADVAERIQKEIAPSFLIQGHEIFITQSIGIAIRSDRYERPDQVLRDADIAMYQAKSKGKARYEFFEDSMHSNIVERLQLEADLRVATEHHEGFVLHYQPILDVKTQQLVGFEALVRWLHPRRGLIPPMTFIPIAEETGMIHGLGEWILRESCSQLMRWQRQYQVSYPLKMSTNVSGKQFLKPGFAEKLIDILADTGMEPGSLAIEITESIIMEDVEIAVATMMKLRSHGVHIHIDDFGTGYSSLSYLHNFPVNALKIDRSFISRMSGNEENREIVKAIISLAQNLNLSVIAEGIELVTQLHEIKDMECQFAQGYYFTKPLPVSELDTWMQNERVFDDKG